MLDLSRENVPNGSCSNAEWNSKRTGDERLIKIFEPMRSNWWTANENFRTDEWLIEIFEQMRSNRWTANEFFQMDEVEWMNDKWIFSNG